jgi:hypothetical protein
MPEIDRRSLKLAGERGALVAAAGLPDASRS